MTMPGRHCEKPASSRVIPSGGRQFQSGAVQGDAVFKSIRTKAFLNPRPHQRRPGVGSAEDQ